MQYDTANERETSRQDATLRDQRRQGDDHARDLMARLMGA